MGGRAFLRCLSVILILLVSFSFTAEGGEDDFFSKMRINPIKGNKKAPDFSLTDLNGKGVEIKQFIGKVIFLNFWATWQVLNYEVKQLPSGKSSIDFCYSFDDKRKIYFELRLVTQRAWIRALEGAELKAYNCFQIELGGNDQREEIIRLQNILLLTTT